MEWASAPHAANEVSPRFRGDLRIFLGGSQLELIVGLTMRILMLHNRYDVRGGEDESTDCEFRLLRERGHEIELVEANNSDIGKSVSKIEAAASAVWSRKWHAEVAHKLGSGGFDILHVQNFFPLISPSVYYAARLAGVPVVQAVRNYRLTCPSANLFRDGQVCHSCLGTSLKLPGIWHACYRGSRVGSATVAAMSAVHRGLGTWGSKVSAFVAISNYVRDVLIQDRFDDRRIVVKPNFVEVSGAFNSRPAAERKHILYVGRLTREKGLDVLIEAYKLSGIKIPLKLLGEGVLEGGDVSGVQVLGKTPLEEVYRLMSEAHCVVMPGRWAEPFGRVAIEAFAAGTPVIASNLGGVAEIVEDSRTGFLVPSGDVAALAGRMKRIVTDDELLERLSRAALQVFHDSYSAESNYNMIMKIYNNVIASDKRV